MSLSASIIEEIRATGPITLAHYMERALYDPDAGYYARAAQRSGRDGDFYTSVDVGPLFGELLARQFAEMRQILRAQARGWPCARRFMLVEAGAGNGRLARDVLDGLARIDPEAYADVELHLVERSAAARRAQPDVLGPHAALLSGTGAELPERVAGVIFANELLDALPVHRVLMTTEGLRELYVTVRADRLVEEPGPPSTPRLAGYLAALGVTLDPGARAELGLAAEAWVRHAARRLEQGFLVLIDYGHEARNLYSAAHGDGTVMTFARHQPGPPAAYGRDAPWLTDAGERDITAHVDFTTVLKACEQEGLTLLGLLDQTYFLLGLGIVDDRVRTCRDTVEDLKRRIAIKTLMLPGGLGNTHKVLILGKQVGRPGLAGCSSGTRMT